MAGGPPRAAALAAILAGGALLVWPAFANGYPILFSDTAAFLHQTLGPLMIWDKPWIYGPLLHALHWRQTLWGPAVAQGLLVSHLLWLAARAWRGRATPLGHLALAAFLALGTAAPWSAALLMPDVLAPVTVLALALLGVAADRLTRAERAWLTLVAAVAIAAHLSHLPVAAALVAVTLLLARSWRPALRVAAPLGLAVPLLLATNAAGHGRPGLSPHGASFLLARLVADGPAARTIAAGCRDGRGWYLCAWAGRLPGDSDEFLWSPDSPVNRDAGGRPRVLGGAMLAPEAGEILRATLRREPLGVARAMAGNAWRQLGMARVGDTLGPRHLDATVRMLAQGFPAAEQRRFAASLQQAGGLEAVAAPLRPLHAVVLGLGALGAALALRRAAARAPRDDGGGRRRLGLLVCVLVGVGVNAAATGALSAPHHRYQARIAWLLPLAAVLALGRDRAARRADARPSGPAGETRPAAGARTVPGAG